MIILSPNQIALWFTVKIATWLFLNVLEIGVVVFYFHLNKMFFS